MRRLRIGVDSDSTLFDIFLPWAVLYNDHREDHGHAVECGAPPTWAYYVELCKTCYRQCVNDPEVFLLSEPYPGVSEGLAYLNGFADLFVVSHRNADLLPVFEELYTRHGIFDYFVDFKVGFDKKIDTCKKLRLDCLIDDSPSNITALAGSKTLPLIFNQDYNTHIAGLRAHGWGDVCRQLNLWRFGALRDYPRPWGLDA